MLRIEKMHKKGHHKMRIVEIIDAKMVTNTKLEDSRNHLALWENGEREGKGIRPMSNSTRRMKGE